MIDICRKSPPRHRVALFSQTATATDLWDNGGRNNTQDCDLKCPGGHPRQQKAARITSWMSSLLPCCLVALLPYAPNGTRDTPVRPWRISILLSVASVKAPPEKGRTFPALSIDLQTFICHGIYPADEKVERLSSAPPPAEGKRPVRVPVPPSWRAGGRRPGGGSCC